MFALVNLAEADAVIVSWDNKYQLRTSGGRSPRFSWPTRTATPPPRPIPTGCRSSPRRRIPATQSAPARSAARRVKSSSSSTAPTISALPRRCRALAIGSFTSFSQVSQEAADSRMYGGIHFRFEDERGRDDGIALGQFVFANELQPIPEPGTWVLLVLGLVGCLAGRRSGRVS